MIKIEVEDHGLILRIGRFLDHLPSTNADAVDAIAAKGRDDAKTFAPIRLGYLRSALTAEHVLTAGTYAEARVFIRGGTPREHGKTAAAYGIFQEEGFRVAPQHQHAYMRPAADLLQAGGAEQIMDRHILKALLEAGIEAT